MSTCALLCMSVFGATECSCVALNMYAPPFRWLVSSIFECEAQEIAMHCIYFKASVNWIYAWIEMLRGHLLYRNQYRIKCVNLRTGCAEPKTLANNNIDSECNFQQFCSIKHQRCARTFYLSRRLLQTCFEVLSIAVCLQTISRKWFWSVYVCVCVCLPSTRNLFYHHSLVPAQTPNDQFDRI